MSKKPASSSLRSFVFISPGFLALFLILPVLFILSRFIGLFRMIPLSFTMIQVNFIALLLLVTLRFVSYLLRLRRNLQYDGVRRPGSEGETVPGSAAQVRQKLAGLGFCFSASGEYGEKRSPALLCTTVFYGGLFLALLVGVIDYARQYSNVVLLGVGNPAQLASSGTGLMLGEGYLSSTKDLPQLQVKKQILPNSEWPHGATEIALLSADKVELARKTIAWGREPLKYGAYEFHMGRLIYDVGLNIYTKSGYFEFANYVRLQPIKKDAKPPYTHATAFKGDQQRGRWEVLYDPQTRNFRLTLKNKDAVLADGEMTFGKDVKKEIGGFLVEFAGMGNWSEIHIVRSRHMYLIIFGAVIAVIGGLMRLYFRPQQVWLEEAPGGCRFWSVGNEAQKFLKVEG